MNLYFCLTSRSVGTCHFFILKAAEYELVFLSYVRVSRNLPFYHFKCGEYKPDYELVIFFFRAGQCELAIFSF